mmetsp:Transcript_9765/g.16853  ORF Transcript_9765/g.16853 Transcript_9765/m.16853 type:complete len:246 (-) Transcript_9765:382-1119(-)
MFFLCYCFHNDAIAPIIINSSSSTLPILMVGLRATIFEEAGEFLAGGAELGALPVHLPAARAFKELGHLGQDLGLNAPPLGLLPGNHGEALRVAHRAPAHEVLLAEHEAEVPHHLLELRLGVVRRHEENGGGAVPPGGQLRVPCQHDAAAARRRPSQRAVVPPGGDRRPVHHVHAEHPQPARQAPEHHVDEEADLRGVGARRRGVVGWQANQWRCSWRLGLENTGTAGAWLAECPNLCRGHKHQS